MNLSLRRIMPFNTLGITLEILDDKIKNLYNVTNMRRKTGLLLRKKSLRLSLCRYER